MVYTIGTKVDFTVCITENGFPVSNLNIFCSIKRNRDNLFYDGVDWVITESWLSMSEVKPGIYIYTFDQAQVDNSVEEIYFITYKCSDTGYEFQSCENYVFIDFAKEYSVQLIKDKTDNLPNDPASQSLVEQAISNTEVNISGDIATLDVKIDEIKNLIEFVKEVEEGNWKIDPDTKQMIFYDSAGNELMRFNLYDSQGQLSVVNVYERRRV